MDVGLLVGKAATLQRGAALFVLTWVLLQAVARAPRLSSKGLSLWLPAWVSGWGMLYAVAYLVHPSHADHVEASALVMGEHLLRGLPLYPTTPGHTMDGLLYGPLLAVLNALSLSLPLDAFLGSKLLALASLGAALWLSLRGLQDRRAWACLAFLGPFELLFLDRAEAHLLLLSALGLWLRDQPDAPRRAWTLGLLAGLASSLKVHGALYLLAMFLWRQPDSLHRPGLWLRFGVGWACGALPWFLLHSVSLQGYLHFLHLATQHGIQPRIALDNGVFLLALWLPVLGLRRDLSGTGLPTALSWASLGAVACVEGLTALLGAKQGGGVWHLLPFVLLHAHIVDALLRLPGQDSPARLRSVRLALWPLLSLALSTACVLGPAAWHLVQSRSDVAQARAELAELAAQHPGLLIATGGSHGYELSYLRVDLERQGMRQIDYPAYIDQRWAGVSDAPLAQALQTCHIPHVAVPRGEPAFAHTSSYSRQPLSSDAVRQAFAERFVPTARTPHFDLYRCQAPT